jgi:hypothetical protein
MPTTYVELYRQSPDPLGGDYGHWLAGHSQVAANPGAVRAAMLGAPDTVAKVYLMLCPGPDGRPRVRSVFRPRQYAPLPGIVTPWDGNVYGFATDLGPGNQITTVQWPEDAFHLSAADVFVKDVASMAEALTENGGAASLGPYVVANPNVEVVRTRMMMVVPHPYVPLVLGASLTPREAWMRLSTAITADNRMVACAPLLDWLRVACTVRPLAEHAVAGAVAQSPVYHLPPVAVVPDAALAQHSWDVVIADMPQLLGATRSQEQHLMHAVAVLQQTQIASATASALTRAESRAPKRPSSKFPATIDVLLRQTGTAAEDDLADVWHSLANASKAETRGCIDAALRARAREDATSPNGAAATASAPLVTKEVVERFTQQRLYSTSPDDLEEGMQLFLFAPGPLHHDAEVRVRTNLYDLVSSGAAAPSVGDLRALASTKIHVPTSHFTLTTALQRHSLALDVYLTPLHPLCVYYRTWIATVWSRLQMDLAIYIDEVYNGDSATAYSRFARWISLRLNTYLVRLTDYGVGAVALPTLHQFEDLVYNRENPFAAVPSKYLVIADTPPSRGPPAPVPSRGPPAPALPGGEPPPRNPRASAAVENPSPVAELLTAFQAIGWRSRQCYNAKQPPRGSAGQICVPYHGMGSCFDGCGRKDSHKPLSGPEKDKVLAYYVELQALAALA